MAVGSHSRRPLQTVTPLAEALKLAPVTTHTKGEEQALVADALGRPGTVLICWQDIPRLGRGDAGRPASKSSAAQVRPNALPAVRDHRPGMKTALLLRAMAAPG